MKIRFLGNVLTVLVGVILLCGMLPVSPANAASIEVVPTLINISPGSGTQGEVLTSVVVVGLNLTGAAAVNFSGAGIVATDISVLFDTMLTATITISANATPGARDVTVTTAGGTSLPMVGGFTVTAAPTSSLSLSAPGNVPPASDFFTTINITNASNLHGYEVNLFFDSTVIQVAGTELSTGNNSGIVNGLVNGTPIPSSGWSYWPVAGISGDEIKLQGTLPGSNSVSGSGYLAKVHFNVIGSPGSQTTIDLSQIDLADSVGGHSFPSLPGSITVNVTSNTSAGPAVSALFPNSGAPGAILNFVTIAGSNLTGASAVTFNSSDVAASNLSVINDGAMTATITVSANATAGPRNITVTTPAGTSLPLIGGFTVTGPLPPTLSSISPDGGNQGASLTGVIIHGSNLIGASAVTFNGSGVTASNLVVNSSTQITVSITISANATTGPRNVAVTTPVGTSSPLIGGFTVRLLGTPSLIFITPLTGAQGTTLNGVKINGSDLIGVTAVTFNGTGVTASNLVTVNSTLVTATISVSANATPGFRDITVTNSVATSSPLTSGFIVTSPLAGVISLSAPASVQPGTTFNATINVAGASQISAYTVFVTFDPAALELAGSGNVTGNNTGLQGGSINGTSVPIVYTQTFPGGIVILAGLSENSSVSGSGYLAKVSFNVTGISGTQTFLNLFYAVFDDVSGNETFPVIPDPLTINIGAPVPLPPSITTNQAANLTGTSATLSGTLTSLGSAVSANLSVGYGIQHGGPYTMLAGPIATANTTLPLTFSANITGLSMNVTYFYIAQAQTTSLTVNGTELSFIVIPGSTATKLAFTTQPGGATAGAILNPQPVVAIQDPLGTTVTSGNYSITLSLSGNGTLSGVSTVQAVNGIATFSGLSVNLPGICTLTATSSPVLTPASSADFNITAAPASKLAFTTQPGGANAGASLNPQPVVTIQDALGTTVTSGNYSITLSLSGNGTLSGVTTVQTVNGVATFNGLSINIPGTFTLNATSNPALTPAASTSFNITPNPPAKLAFTTQPGGAIAGSILNPQPVVAVQDAIDNTITNDNTTTVTLTISGGNQGIFSGTKTVTAVNGIAAFSGLSVNQTGTFTFSATSVPALTGATTISFGITPGTASKLVFNTQPGGASAGNPLAPQPALSIQDIFGNVVRSDNSTSVTLALSGNASLLSGTKTVTAVNGVATFSGLSINQTGTYSLSATSLPALIGTTSNSFNIAAGPASKLAFATQPGGATAGISLSPQPAIAIQDAFGNPVNSDNSTVVTLTLSGGNPSLLSGTKTITAVNGIATFSGLSINQTGTYTLSANSTPALITAVSISFTVTPGPAIKLAFTTQPGGTSPGAFLNPQPVVAVQDSLGNTVTSGNNSISLSLTGNGTLSGTTTLPTVNGIATFSGLSVNQTGNFTLTASSQGLTPAVSNTFTVFDSVPVVNLSVSLQGSLRPAAGWILLMKVKFFSPGTVDELNGTPVLSFNVASTKSGNTAIAQATGVAPGTYDITISGNQTLTNVKKSVVVNAQSTDVSMGTLLSGDANGSGLINIQDFGILAGAYGKTSGSVGYDIRADFDLNGLINISDFGLLAANYSKFSLINVP